MVWICHHDTAVVLPSSQFNHRKVFKQLTTDSSRSNHEHFRILYLFQKTLADNASQPFGSVLDWQSFFDKILPSLLIFRWSLYNLWKFSHEILIDRSVFASNSFEGFLSGNSSKESTERSKSAWTCVTEQFQVLEILLFQLWFSLFEELYEWTGIIFVPGKRKPVVLFRKFS